MGISEQCRAAMIEHGVLMKDGKPAGAELMNKDVLRVAIVQAGEDGQFPESFVSNIENQPTEPKGMLLEILKNPATFPFDVREAADRAISYWHEGEIRFVNAGEPADLTIAAHDQEIEGRRLSFHFATSPVHDGDDVPSGHEVPVLALHFGAFNDAVRQYNLDKRVQPILFSAYSEEAIRHEFGHNLGVFHPFDAVEFVQKYASDACDQPSLSKLSDKFQLGVMAYGKNEKGVGEESAYDIGVRDFIRGNPPSGPGQ